VAVGKASFDAQKLVENVDSFIGYIKKIRPPTVKGTYIIKACLSTTMSPSVQLTVE